MDIDGKLTKNCLVGQRREKREREKDRREEERRKQRSGLNRSEEGKGRERGITGDSGGERRR